MRFATDGKQSVPCRYLGKVGINAACLDGKLYAIGGGTSNGVSSVEIFDPQTSKWSDGPSLPTGVHRGAAVALDDRILVFGGSGEEGTSDKVFEFKLSSNQWTSKEPMPTAREAQKRFSLVEKYGLLGASITTQILMSLRFMTSKETHGPLGHT